MEIAVVSMASNVSLSKGHSLSFPSIPTKLYLTSIGKVGSRLYIKKNGENVVEVCLLTLCANKTPSIILGQSQGFPSRTFINESLMVLFCCSQIPFDWELYAEVLCCSLPVMLCKLTNFANFINKLQPSVFNLNLHTSMPTYKLIKYWRMVKQALIFNRFCIQLFPKIVYTDN